MRQAVDRFIKRHQLLKKGAIVVIGVSGGPDSMALLDYLQSVRAQWDLTLIAASADHGLRGKQSADEVQYVNTYCLEHKILFESARLDVKTYIKEHGGSIEAAARICRYKFFKKVMLRFGADFLVLGHHGDDQIETMLMREVRGSIAEARSGIPVRRPFAGGEIIRPLLAVDKKQIVKYCDERGIKPRHDPSNDSDDYTRNRFRHHVLPFLKSENPNVHIRFQYESETMRQDEQYLRALAEARLGEVVFSKDSDEMVLSIPAFLDMPMPLQRRMIHLILNYLYRQIPPSLSVIHIEEVLHLLSREHPSGHLDLPNRLRVYRSYDRLFFTFKTEKPTDSDYEFELKVPGESDTPLGTIRAEFAGNDGIHPEDRDVFVCDADLVSLPLRIRTRRPGDRLSLKGMKASKKVKAIFIDRKIRRHLREIWPLVTDSDGKVLWIPGLKHSGAGKPSEKTKRRIVLRFHPSGDVWEDIEQ